MDNLAVDQIVSDFLAKQKEEIEGLKNQEKTKLLDSLGLFTYKREYAPEDYIPSTNSLRRMYNKSETIDGVKRYYREVKKVYPEISDETYNELQQVIKEKEALTPKPSASTRTEKAEDKKPEEFDVVAKDAWGTGFAAKFMRTLAWILWIGGLILSVVLSLRQEADGYYSTKTVFDWASFLTFLSIYAFAGCFALCMSELFANISSINAKLGGYHVKPSEMPKPRR